MKIKFNEQKSYNGIIYESGKTYEISEELGMAKRWLDRGCTAGTGEALADPNSPAPVKKPEVVKVEKKPSKGNKSVANEPPVEDTTSIDL